MEDLQNLKLIPLVFREFLWLKIYLEKDTIFSINASQD